MKRANYLKLDSKLLNLLQRERKIKTTSKMKFKVTMTSKQIKIKSKLSQGKKKTTFPSEPKKTNTLSIAEGKKTLLNSNIRSPIYDHQKQYNHHHDLQKHDQK